MKSPFGTKDLLALAGISRETLRFYEREGVFEAAGRTPAGHRIYTEESVAEIHFVKAAKEVGFTLREIVEFNQMRRKQAVDLSTLKAIASSKLDALQEKIRALQEMHDTLRAFVEEKPISPERQACFAKLGLKVPT